MIFVKPSELAAQTGFSERSLRQKARELRACRVLGKTMVFTPDDVEAIKAALNNPGGVIYFVQCGPYVKIGFTTDLARRLSQIRRAIPYSVQLLHVEAGTRDQEAEYQKRFASERYQREWFYFRGSLADYIWDQQP